MTYWKGNGPVLMESKRKPTRLRCLVQASVREVRCEVDHCCDVAGLLLQSYRRLAVREPGADLGK